MNALRILLVGEESAGLQTLRLLLNGPHELVGVLASPTHEAKSATVWNLATKQNIKTWPAPLVREPGFVAELLELDIDLLLNVHSLYLINAAILAVPKLGAFNLHPGPLPGYAGLNVPSWAIYNGKLEHAVTLHEMTPQIDAGTITYSEPVTIAESDTGFSLMAKCIRAGVPLIEKLLQAASAGADFIPQHRQDFSQRRYFNRSAPNAGRIDWTRSAVDVVNHVRAADYSPFKSPWGSPECQWHEATIGIASAERTHVGHQIDQPGLVGDVLENGVLVAAADEWVLVKKIVLDGFVCKATTQLRSGDVLLMAPKESRLAVKA